MVNVQQQLINPSIGRTDYGVVTEATRLGLQEVLQANKEKQARIRASLKEVEENAKTNALTQAKWMGAIKNNPELTKDLDSAPPEIQKAYKKVQKGTGGLKDNSVIASYLDGVMLDKQNRAAQDAALIAEQLKLAETDYKKGLTEQTQSAIIANQALANYRNAQAMAELADARQGGQRDLVAAIGGVSGIPTPAAQRATPAAPPISAMDFGVPGSIGGIPTTRVSPTPAIPSVLLQQPATPAPADIPAGEQPSLVERNPFVPSENATSIETPTPQPGEPVFTDSEGNVVPMTPANISDPKVAEMVQEGAPVESAVRIVEGEKELNASKSEYIFGKGNVRNLPTASEYQARLLAAGAELDDARKQTDLAVETGQVYVEPSSETIREKEKEFEDGWRTDAQALSTIIGSSGEMNNVASQLIEEADWTTTGVLGFVSGKFGLGVPATGTSGRQLAKFISQLRSDAALTTIGELKKAAKTGATGLGQVSVIEFTSLIEQSNTIDQMLSKDQLIDATNRYMYNRNKAAYNAYMGMVEKYGRNAVNSLKGVSERKMATILRDIDQYEKTNREGRAIAARDGYYADRVSLGQPRGIAPSPEPTSVPADQNDAYLRDKAEFMGRQENRETDEAILRSSLSGPLGSVGLEKPGMAMTLSSPSRAIPAVAAGTLMPGILRFFNVIPDATDAQRVEQRYQSLKDDIEIK